MNKLDNIKANLFQRDFSIDKPFLSSIMFGLSKQFTIAESHP